MIYSESTLHAPPWTIHSILLFVLLIIDFMWYPLFPWFGIFRNILVDILCFTSCVIGALNLVDTLQVTVSMADGWVGLDNKPCVVRVCV